MFPTNQKTDFNYPFYKKGKQSIKAYFQSLDFDKTDIGLSIFTGLLVVVFILLFSFQNTSNNSVNFEKIKATALLPTKISTANLKPLPKIINLPITSISDKTKIQEIKLTKAIPLAIEQPIVKKISKPKLNQPKAKPVFPSSPVVTDVAPVATNSKVSTTKILAVNNKLTSSKAENLVSKTPISKPTTPPANKIVKEDNSTKETPSTVSKWEKTQPQQMNSSFAINKKISEEELPSSFFTAKLLAEQEDKLLLIKFGADWCLPCKQMDKNTFKETGVNKFLKRNYVKLDVNVEDFDGVNLQNYFQVRTLPTLLIFNAKGKFVAKYETFISAAQMITILEKHHLAETPKPPLTVEDKKEERIPAVFFNQVILQKTKSGEPITSLKAKAKNWRNIYLNFSTQYVTKGELMVKIKETRSGKIVSEQIIPWSMNSRTTDTTTTDFQLDISLKKRKKKKGTYVLEIYHMNDNDSLLIGKTTLIKGGDIIPLY